MSSTSIKLKQTYVFMLMIFLLSCSSDTKIFEEYVKFPNMSWNRFNILTFEVPVEKAGEIVDIDLTIRHIPEIPYKNLEFNMSLFTPSGDMRTADYTFDFQDNEGNQLSDCMGDLCDITMTVRKGLILSDTGKLNIEIENKYPKIEMPGIMEVGLIIRKSNAE